MTHQRNNTPEWAGALGQSLALESAWGYDNVAVIGGLDRFRERWQSELAAYAGDAPDAAFLLRQDYAAMPAEQREVWVERWKSLIGFTETDTPPLPKSATAESHAAHPAAGSREANGSLPRPAHPAAPERAGRTPAKSRPAFGAPPDGHTTEAVLGDDTGCRNRQSVGILGTG